MTPVAFSGLFIGAAPPRLLWLYCVATASVAAATAPEGFKVTSATAALLDDGDLGDLRLDMRSSISSMLDETVSGAITGTVRASVEGGADRAASLLQRMAMAYHRPLVGEGSLAEAPGEVTMRLRDSFRIDTVIRKDNTGVWYELAKASAVKSVSLAFEKVEKVPEKRIGDTCLLVSHKCCLYQLPDPDRIFTVYKLFQNETTVDCTSGHHNYDAPSPMSVGELRLRYNLKVTSQLRHGSVAEAPIVQLSEVSDTTAHITGDGKDWGYTISSDANDGARVPTAVSLISPGVVSKKLAAVSGKLKAHLADKDWCRYGSAADGHSQGSGPSPLLQSAPFFVPLKKFGDGVNQLGVYGLGYRRTHDCLDPYKNYVSLNPETASSDHGDQCRYYRETATVRAFAPGCDWYGSIGSDPGVELEHRQGPDGKTVRALTAMRLRCTGDGAPVGDAENITDRFEVDMTVRYKSSSLFSYAKEDGTRTAVSPFARDHALPIVSASGARLEIDPSDSNRAFVRFFADVSNADDGAAGPGSLQGDAAAWQLSCSGDTGDILAADGGTSTDEGPRRRSDDSHGTRAGSGASQSRASRRGAGETSFFQGAGETTGTGTRAGGGRSGGGGAVSKCQRFMDMLQSEATATVGSPSEPPSAFGAGAPHPGGGDPGAGGPGIGLAPGVDSSLRALPHFTAAVPAAELPAFGSRRHYFTLAMPRPFLYKVIELLRSLHGGGASPPAPAPGAAAAVPASHTGPGGFGTADWHTVRGYGLFRFAEPSGHAVRVTVPFAFNPAAALVALQQQTQAAAVNQWRDEALSGKEVSKFTSGATDAARRTAGAGRRAAGVTFTPESGFFITRAVAEAAARRPFHPGFTRMPIPMTVMRPTALPPWVRSGRGTQRCLSRDLVIDAAAMGSGAAPPASDTSGPTGPRRRSAGADRQESVEPDPAVETAPVCRQRTDAECTTRYGRARRFDAAVELCVDESEVADPPPVDPLTGIDFDTGDRWGAQLAGVGQRVGASPPNPTAGGGGIGAGAGFVGFLGDAPLVLPGWARDGKRRRAASSGAAGGDAPAVYRWPDDIYFFPRGASVDAQTRATKASGAKEVAPGVAVGRPSSVVEPAVRSAAVAAATSGSDTGAASEDPEGDDAGRRRAAAACGVISYVSLAALGAEVLLIAAALALRCCAPRRFQAAEWRLHTLISTSPLCCCCCRAICCPLLVRRAYYTYGNDGSTAGLGRFSSAGSGSKGSSGPARVAAALLGRFGGGVKSSAGTRTTTTGGRASSSGAATAAHAFGGQPGTDTSDSVFRPGRGGAGIYRAGGRLEITGSDDNGDNTGDADGYYNRGGGVALGQRGSGRRVETTRTTTGGTGTGSYEEETGSYVSPDSEYQRDRGVFSTLLSSTLGRFSRRKKAPRRGAAATPGGGTGPTPIVQSHTAPPDAAHPYDSKGSPSMPSSGEMQSPHRAASPTRGSEKRSDKRGGQRTTEGVHTSTDPTGNELDLFYGVGTATGIAGRGSGVRTRSGDRSHHHNGPSPSFLGNEDFPPCQVAQRRRASPSRGSAASTGGSHTADGRYEAPSEEQRPGFGHMPTPVVVPPMVTDSGSRSTAATPGADNRQHPSVPDRASPHRTVVVGGGPLTVAGAAAVTAGSGSGGQAPGVGFGPSQEEQRRDRRSRRRSTIG